MNKDNNRFDRRPSFKGQEPEKYRKNNEITSRTIFLIDEKGEKIGETPLSQALQRAYDLDLDLVEVAPNAAPPVCKILSWSKFKYEQEKKAREQRKGSRQKKDKGMRFPITLDIGDKEHKMKRVKEFLSKGHRVKVDVFIRGRIPMEKAEELLNQIRLELEEYKTLEERLARQGRNVSLTFLPK